MKVYLVVMLTLLSALSQAQPMRAIGLDFPQLSLAKKAFATYTQKLCDTGFNTVGITAGRLDWTYFRWAEHEAYWSNEVSSQQRDLVRDALGSLKQCKTIDNLSLIVDVFAPRYIEAHPESATFTYQAERLDYQVSSLELAEGHYGERLLEMLDYLAANFPVDSISLTELFYYQEGYSTAERESYKAFSGHADWPRTAKGEIDIDAASIGIWRSSLVSRFVAKAAQIVQKHGKKLLVDVRISWDDLANQGRRFGQDYPQLLEHADALVLWVYLGLNSETPEILRSLQEAYEPFADRLIISIGLWDNKRPSLDPELLKRFLALADDLEFDVWITPSSLMTKEHYEVVRKR